MGCNPFTTWCIVLCSLPVLRKSRKPWNAAECWDVRPGWGAALVTTRARATPSILGDPGLGRKRRPSSVNTGRARGAMMYQSGLVTMIITVEVVVAEEALGELVPLLPRALPPVVAGGIKRDLGALRQVAVGSEKGPLSKPSSESRPKVEEPYSPPCLTMCLCK